MAPVVTVGILGNRSDGAFGLGATVPPITPEVILGAVISSLLVAKLHLEANRIRIFQYNIFKFHVLVGEQVSSLTEPHESFHVTSLR